jgi:hypothetical protein
VENNIKKLVSGVGRVSIVVVTIILAGGLMMTANKACKTAQKQAKERVVAFPALPVQPVETGEVITQQIGEQYPDMWIAMDPTRRCEFFVKDAEAGDDSQIRLQFTNGTQSQWVSRQSHIRLGSAKWAKTFRVKTREGSATLVVKCH